jgi:acyl-CoA synthetase (AMP-forming)/AMP-acid ligase II
MFSFVHKELQAATDHLAEYLTSSALPLKRGDRVLLVFFPGLDFTVSLIACFKAGLIAVPVFPPDPRKLKKDLHHFDSIQKSCDATIALTNAQFNFIKRLEDIKNFFSNISWPHLKWVEIDEYLRKGKRYAAIPDLDRVYPSPEVVSFLQYTSGSTSEPKGVMISHGNLAHNLTLITTDGQASQSSVCVSWLPQYHDMGLIGMYFVLATYW